MDPIRWRPWTIILSVGLGLLAIWMLGAASQQEARLPGAEVVVEAIDYASLQDALDALGAEGGVVRIPPGRFEIDRPLMLTTGETLLVGSGPATRIINRNRDGQPALIIQSPEIDENANARIWRVQISDIHIEGNSDSGAGIVARGVNEIYLEGVSVTACGGDGIRLDNCYEDPRINDCLLTYNAGAGLNLIGCHDIVVVGNHFEENQDALRCVDGFNLCVTGNNLDDHLRDGVVIENTYGSVVSGNMIEECAGRAIVLDRDCYGITLSANVIAHETGGGIDLIDAHGCAVTGNTFPIVQHDALRIGPDSGRITVSGNAFADSTVGPDQVARAEGDRLATGIHLESTSELVIAGNLFAGLRPGGLVLEGEEPTRYVVIDGNLFVDTATDHRNLKDSHANGNLGVMLIKSETDAD